MPPSLATPLFAGLPNAAYFDYNYKNVFRLRLIGSIVQPCVIGCIGLLRYALEVASCLLQFRSLI